VSHFYQLGDIKLEYFNSIINLFSVFRSNNDDDDDDDDDDRELRISYRIDDSLKNNIFLLSGEENSRRPKHKAKDATLMQRSKTQTNTHTHTHTHTHTERKEANSVALVRERTIPTERQPIVNEVDAKFCR
jgi:hypothetical protein